MSQKCPGFHATWYADAVSHNAMALASFLYFIAGRLEWRSCNPELLRFRLMLLFHNPGIHIGVKAANTPGFSPTYRKRLPMILSLGVDFLLMR